MKQLREKIIRAAHQAGEGHIPSALSILDILWVLYFDILKIDVKNPEAEERDRFILSKGHASLGLYAILAAKGILPEEALADFCEYDSCLGGHPDRNKVPGVEASTGSLAHGFPMAVGVALGLKIKQSPARVVTLIGDGECNEGAVWESALLAAHHQLNNLTCVVDYNHSTDRALELGDLVEKFAAFGWLAVGIDGHNQEQIKQALLLKDPLRPLAIIAATIKGRGIKSMENNPAWHHKAPNDEIGRAHV